MAASISLIHYWIQLLYTNISSTVSINGWELESFLNRLMSICDQFELASGAKRELPEGAGNMVRRGQGMCKNLGGMQHQGEAENGLLEALLHLHGRRTSDSALSRLFSSTHTKTINLVKDTLWSARTLSVFQSKELTLTECCRLAHSKVQDYVLR
eukprot:g39746.t1